MKRSLVFIFFFAAVLSTTWASAQESKNTAKTGKALFDSSCMSCHGVRGEGIGNFPKLAGMAADAFTAKIRDYRAGKQMGTQTAVMAPNAKKLSDDQISSLAAYVAGLK